MTGGIWATNAQSGRRDETLLRQGALYTNHAHLRGMDWYTAVGFGLIPNCRRITALGNNPAVSTSSTPEDIWTGGGIYPWLGSATAMELISSSAADTAAGTGAHTVLVQGLDANYVEITETVALTGLTATPLVKLYYRINGALIASAGTGLVNAGDLTIRDQAGSATRAIIPAGYGITRQSAYTVPAGYTLSIHAHLFCINRIGGSNRDATIANYSHPPGFARMPLEVSITSTPYRHDAVPGVILAEKTDYILRCNYVGMNNTDITAAWLGVLVNNAALAAN